MLVNKVMGLTTTRFVRNNRKTQQYQTVPPTVNQPASDSVAFRGVISHSINSSRKWINYGDIFKQGVNLSGKNLSRAKADLVKLMNANLSRANFERSVFHCANFTGANLTGTNFENSTLDGSWFIDVITDNTNLKTTYLNGAIFKGDFGPWTILEKANVRGVDFSKANLETVNLIGALYDEFTQFPAGFNPEDRGMILYKENGVDFSDKNLGYMRLRYSNFCDANFRKASLKRADLKGCTFENCNMNNINMSKAYAKKVKLVNSNLADAYLRRTNFDKAFLRNVNLRGADLSEANLTWKEAENVSLEGAIYNKDTVFNPGFNPNEHGMFYSDVVYDYLD